MFCAVLMRNSSLNGLPALEALHSAWNSCTNKFKYARYSAALESGLDKIATYYDHTSTSHAYSFVMILDPTQKISHFQKRWPTDLCQEIRENTEEILSSDDESDAPNIISPVADQDAAISPWLREFNQYLDARDEIEDMSLVEWTEWWGINSTRYPVWASLARDYLAIMASSVLNIVEALQFLKCAIRTELLFREEVSTWTEEELEVEDDNGDPEWEDVKEKGWDKILLDDESEKERAGPGLEGHEAQA
ncbi:hypothetical protein AX14_014295 [Amanita brunnescens Koide BX004]|nr:hypothetical protein AX14_014295 [Amanita brunnescens Koide BX004]